MSRVDLLMSQSSFVVIHQFENRSLQALVARQHGGVRFRLVEVGLANKLQLLFNPKLRRESLKLNEAARLHAPLAVLQSEF